MDTYGYVRVSTKEQNEDRQLIAMREFGVTDSRIVLDKQSGKDFERPGYRRLVRKLKADRYSRYQEHRSAGTELR